MESGAHARVPVPAFGQRTPAPTAQPDAERVDDPPLFGSHSRTLSRVAAAGLLGVMGGAQLVWLAGVGYGVVWIATQLG